MPKTNYPRILQEKQKGTRTPIGTGEQRCYICKEVTQEGKWLMDMTRRPFVIRWRCDKDKKLCIEIGKRKKLETSLERSKQTTNLVIQVQSDLNQLKDKQEKQEEKIGGFRNARSNLVRNPKMMRKATTNQRRKTISWNPGSGTKYFQPH